MFCALNCCNVFSNVCINVAYPLTLSPNPSQVTIGIRSLFELCALNFLALHTLDSGFDHFLSLSMHYAVLNSIPCHDLQHGPPPQTPGSIPCSPNSMLPWPHCCMILAKIEKGPAKEYWGVVPHILKLLSCTWLRPWLMWWVVDYIWTIMHILILVKTINAIPE